MFSEIEQIKRGIAKQLGLIVKGKGANAVVIGDVPNGEYKVKINGKKTIVQIKNDYISIR